MRSRRLRRLPRTARGVVFMIRGAREIAADNASLMQLVFDTFAYRMLRITGMGRDRPRTVRLRPDVILTYRRNRGDIAVLYETWVTRSYELPVHVQPGGVILDLGAHVGITAVFLTRRYRPRHYIAIEPVPGNASLARANLDRNGVPARVINAAIGAQDGSGLFAVGGVSTQGRLGEAGFGVPVVTVDTVLSQLDGSDRIALLKIDIEGGEEELFRGPIEWLKRVDCIVAELHPDFCDVSGMLAALSEAGFVEHRIEGGDQAGLEYMSCFVAAGR
jgi:FkbM family methyltransferase